jgi:TRAP-type mannitol/chloroaromatic compound transport system substrate-binding protein
MKRRKFITMRGGVAAGRAGATAGSPAAVLRMRLADHPRRVGKRGTVMKRRDVLTGAGSLATGATFVFPAPAIAQGLRQLKMVTDWQNEDTPGLHANSVNFARTIEFATAGRIKIEVFPSGSLVRPFETFDAVGAGIVDMYHSYEGYFVNKSRAFQFFAAIPFGLAANEQLAWVLYGGGQELWDALSGQFNVKSLPCGNTGAQMGRWFTREVTSPEQYKGLRYRMAGPGAEVLRRMGATVVTLPVSEIMPSIRSGAIDASEWIGPWLDMALGLHKVASYYYYPGFHEPSSGHCSCSAAPASPPLEREDCLLAAWYRFVTLGSPHTERGTCQAPSDGEH